MGYWIERGRWRNHIKMATVESALKVSIKNLIRGLPRRWLVTPTQLNGVVKYEWQTDGRVSSFMGIRFDNPDGSKPAFVMLYTANGVDHKHRVMLTSTPVHFGGVRWWFVCPSCERRCGCLHIAPPGHRVACRKCHNLTYTSAQQAHWGERSSAGELIQALNLITRTKLIKAKLDQTRPWSKKHDRLTRRYFAMIKPLIKLTNQIRNR